MPDELGISPSAPEPQPQGEVVIPPAPAPEVPQQFQNAEGGLDHARLLQSYQELETRLGQQTAPQPAPAPGTPEPQAPEPFDPAALRPFLAEFSQYGALSPASRQALVSQFEIPDGAIDHILHGAQAQRQVYETEVLQSTGLDKSQYGALTSWAQQTMTPAQVTAFNNDVNSMDQTRAIQAIKGLHSQYTQAQAGPVPGGQLVGNPVGGGQPQVFRSIREMTKAMGKDTDYGKDKAYTEQVNEIVKRSPLGIQTKVVDGTQSVSIG